MATKSENADIAVLQTQMTSVQEAVARIEVKLDNQSTNYVTHSEFNEYKKAQNWQKTFLVLATAIVAALITYFFTTIGG